MTTHTAPAEIEKAALKFGYIPLIDCAALVVAKERGLFEKWGLQVSLEAEPSWANIRDKVAMGMLDGAHMLAAMPIAATVGAGPVRVPMVTAFSMSLNGNAVTVSDALYQKLLTHEPLLDENRCLAGAALKSLIEQDKKEGRPPLVFAHVYHFSSQNYQLRYWLAAAGIDPDADVRLVVVPPVQMGKYMRIGNIDGYCVGEPWNSLAVEQGIGRVLISGYDIWNNAPEKVFGVTREWAMQHPNTHKAVIKALLEASMWLDQPEHHTQAARILSDGDYLPLPPHMIETAMSGHLLQTAHANRRQSCESSVFHSHFANFPWLSHAQWFLTQMYRWGQLDEPLDIANEASQVYWPALYKQAATELGLECPDQSTKTEGTHSGPHAPMTSSADLLGPDRFVDGRVFDPEHWLEYLRESLLHHETLNAEKLRALEKLSGQ